ncbi:CGH_3_HP_G0021620.mRNA.1.CDS.1 [Saccharomyces cerevisiae]|nr:CGH_1_HP_G0007160.mRNA.1.CDS.1 [Saccharomyces cerevisiae]CAI4915443.1 CGH_3_HP_G0021620.mRNA.1.CDS.1 [Saccharomyces cerevisiae]CAI4951635.1 CGH_1_HP_G0038230.mRNA.1.CDS.1 [Saccharomyces cerevisiae]CAI5130989.1 CGH_1_HP_G0135930.mRNA.1.CDS.1 [Saccharomyces cerevisiae]CAI6382760.1 CGH_1_HP_G0007160.mRNA.1.CDS.1 [Saccharomyces cerevisiae]
MSSTYSGEGPFLGTQLRLRRDTFCDRSYYRGHNSNNDSGCAVLRMRDRIRKERRLNLGPPALRMVLPRTHDINQLVEHRMDEYGVF